MNTRLIKKLQAGTRQTVVAYGTSLTAGGQWVKDLAEWLDRSYPGQATVHNSGMGGKASNTALAHLDEKVLVHRPDTVFLEFAINDAAPFPPDNLDHGISPEKSRANLNELIDRISRALPDVEIILQTMNSAWDAPNGNGSGSRRPDLNTYYEGYRQVAAARSLHLIDHHAAWCRLQSLDRLQYERYIPDGVHPSAEGSSAVTFSAIQEALKFPSN